MKGICLVDFCFIFIRTEAQRSTEHVTIDWPEQYEWKVVGRQNKNNVSSLTIIPGKETVATASIVGVMSGYKGMRTSNTTQIVDVFRKGLDTCSVLTILKADDSAAHRWVIFKVETPKTDKYPEPESDLYYCIQGEYALFENHVAVKQPKLSPDFEQQWRKVFKESILSK